MDKFTLNYKNPNKIFRINSELGFFKIIKIETIVPNNSIRNLDHVDFKYILSDYDNNNESDVLIVEDIIQKGTHILNKEILNVNKFEFLKIEASYIAEDALEFIVYYEIKNNFLSFDDPFEKFEEHIKPKHNVKVLFSAPFGQGKSTFLNHFFDTNSSEFEVFNVFPVNYSVAQNEDIFKYIKTEILFQLLVKEVPFDKESFSYFETFPMYFKKNPAQILAPLLKLFPLIGRSLFEVYESFVKLLDAYSEYHEKFKKDDKSDTMNFIETLYEKEGSIYEVNFYTQLIRQQLEKLKDLNDKKNVLIIEDLDRMDPDHIFRILNVFAAHFDQEGYTEGLTNKFGFDKIILVGDIKNIESIFRHRYGKEVRFSGYVNKYYSHSPFHYDNKKAIEFIIAEINSELNDQTVAPILAKILLDFLTIDEIALRDLIKLKKENYQAILKGWQHRSNKSSKVLYHRYLYFNIIYLLTQLFDIDTLIQKVQKCKNYTYDPNSYILNIDYSIRIGLPSILLDKANNFEYCKFEYKGMILNLRLESFVRDYFLPDENIFYHSDPVSQQETKYKFGIDDFYEIFLLNLLKYKELNGFD